MPFLIWLHLAQEAFNSSRWGSQEQDRWTLPGLETNQARNCQSRVYIHASEIAFYRNHLCSVLLPGHSNLSDDLHDSDSDYLSGLCGRLRARQRQNSRDTQRERLHTHLVPVRTSSKPSMVSNDTLAPGNSHNCSDLLLARYQHLNHHLVHLETKLD